MKVLSILLLSFSMAFNINALGQENSFSDEVNEECKLLRIGRMIFIMTDTSFSISNDTFDVLDMGSMSINCTDGINSDFNNKDYNFFKACYGREAYFDKSKKDSILAWLDVKVFVFDARVKYKNLKTVLKKYEYYHKLEINNRTIILKSITSADIIEILLKRDNNFFIRFEDCYFSTPL